MCQITVAISVYNASQYICECIDSILSQNFSDFELLIVDDGSTDNTLETISRYDDTRIRVVTNKHDYIDSLNLLLKLARGKYIARMDADDIMFSERLTLQYKYMEEHPYVDVLGGCMQLFGDRTGRTWSIPRICMHDMINSCCIAHPTVMLRISSIERMCVKYEQEYKYAEDYKLWIEILKHNGIIHNLQDTLIKYRTSSGQISCTKSDIQQSLSQKIRIEAANWLMNKERAVAKDIGTQRISANKLSVVIPFLNEMEEVINTVADVRRTAGNSVDIIVVNDCSDIPFEYERLLKPFNVIYVVNEIRIGAAAAKHKGVMTTVTPYFVLLDAHMRCFTDNWHNILIEILEQNSQRILCCQTSALHKDEFGKIEPKGSVSTDGAYIDFDYTQYIPGIHWTENHLCTTKNVHKIPCILGAGYVSSKSYWEKIRGLEGLIHYGSEETYLSIKAWLEGGGCYLVNDVVFGHIYRQKPPYRIVTSSMHYNTFVISNTLFPTSMRCMADAIGYNINKNIFNEICFWTEINKKELLELREYYTKTFPNSFDSILDMNDVINFDKAASIRIESERLNEILKFVLSDKYIGLGIIKGCMGKLLALSSYLKYRPNDIKVEYAANTLLSEICTSLQNISELPYSFQDGLLGIGWGLLYLKSSNLTNERFDTELSAIDNKIQELCPDRMTNNTLETGVCGILCYVVNRLHDNPNAFSNDFLTELRKAAAKMLKNDIDYQARYYALRIFATEGGDTSSHKPIWKDVMDLPFFLPKQQRWWESSIKGAWGFLINLSNKLYAIEHFKNWQEQ